MTTATHSIKHRKVAKALSFEQIGKLPPEQFADALVAKVNSEKTPVLSTKLVEAIEAFVQHSGPERRAALAYLSRPWPEITSAIQRDRPTAVAFANVYHLLGDLAARYTKLAGYMKSAEARLMVALCSREDSRAVMREGRKAAQIVATQRDAAFERFLQRATGGDHHA